MPFYDYKCNKCGKKFEVLHGMGAKPSGIKCEFCGAEDISRVYYPTVSNSEGGAQSTSNRSGCGSCSSGECSSCSH